MRIHSTVSAVVLASTLVMTGACSDSTGPNNRNAVDVSELIQQASLGGLGNTGASMLGGITSTIPIPGATGCVLNPTTQSFSCAAVTNNGVAMSLSYSLLDASGQRVITPDPKVVDGIHTIMDMAGTLTPPPGIPITPLAIQRHDDRTLKGLLSGQHVVNGVVTATMSYRDPAGALAMTTNSTETLSNVTTSREARFPTGGTITTDINTVLGNSPPTVSHVIMTFQPSGTATMVLTSGSMTMTCQLNLSQRPAIPDCQ